MKGHGTRQTIIRKTLVEFLMKVYFPYVKVREEQARLINDVAETIKEKKVLIAHAPTGLGKTVSSLAPAISYALENEKKVFFLTPKISQHEIVLETVREMNKKFNLDIKAIDLVGRRQMCIDPFLSRADFNKGFYDACFKKKKNGNCKFYNNVKGKTPKQKAIAYRKKAPLLRKYKKSYTDMKDLCSMYEMCRYEITLEMSRKANVIVGDYSHLFNEDISKGILGQANIALKDCIVIVDEAHNLGDRLRDMLSSNLDLDALERASKESRSVGDFETEMVMKDIAKEIYEMAKKLSLEKKDAVLEPKDLDLLKYIGKENFELIITAAEKFMKKNQLEGSYLLNTHEFLYQLMREKQHTLHVVERGKNLGISINPLDPSEIGADVLNGVHSAILMSGTLLPLEMHANLLGIKMAVLKEYKSPFPKKNRLNLFVNKTTTKYASRSTEQYKEIGKIVSDIVKEVPGNTIVFFPSFEMMQTIKEHIGTGRKVLKQEREMTAPEKEKLIHNFKLLGQNFGGVLLAVSGGSIAEGVDFPGDGLRCAIVVGIPFAKVSIYSDALIKYYQQKFGKGWDYAYNAPAISKAVQAAGRVIRTEEDRGVCVFLDERFSSKQYEKFYPKDFGAEQTKEPEKLVKEFFST
jgi:DNA excision repair protein ERCC-2